MDGEVATASISWRWPSHSRGRRIHAIACDTDGIDGTEDAAGAHIRPDTLMRAASAGLNPFKMLEEHDSFTFFEKLDDLIWTAQPEPTLMIFER